ncbi:trypsin-like serine protease [Pseudoalteromonas sp. H105]|jgi:secreted trypsin-like serine protease|uniref:trypsin-like serine protease n=1 Tax=Pseudoalteromonas sp. H105 TaxID=1348393 RepID=UPI00073201C9|nr:trypsin-like serine protease [Pseudoalteromonas sp. H105]KTF15185.1 peptidase S1 [Pseudoalteromonas sp. H105]
MNKAFFTTLLIMSFYSNAIVIKHDKNDFNYKTNINEFPPLATFYVGGAHGSLIAPKWILTAAHASFCIEKGSKVEINGKLETIENLFIHKLYKPGSSHDIALVELAQAVQAVKPAIIETKNNELNKQVWFIGIGGTGNGLIGETVDNFANKGVLRKAQNQVTYAQGPLLKFKFDNGSEALPLEGVSGGGDSGGPAYIKTKSGIKVLGISSRFEKGGIGKYGIDEVYTRVSYFNDWIHEVIYHPNPSSLASVTTKLSQSKLPAGLTTEMLPMVCKDITITQPVVKSNTSD